MILRAFRPLGDYKIGYRRCNVVGEICRDQNPIPLVGAATILYLYQL